MSESPVRFPTDRAAYFESQMKLAALSMGGAMAILWALGNPDVWTGAVAGLGATGLRALILRSAAFSTVWELRDGTLAGPGNRRIPVDDIVRMRRLGSFVQVTTCAGDRHLIKYQADPEATIAALRRAQRLRQATREKRA